MAVSFGIAKKIVDIARKEGADPLARCSQTRPKSTVPIFT